MLDLKANTNHKGNSSNGINQKFHGKHHKCISNHCVRYCGHTIHCQCIQDKIRSNHHGCWVEFDYTCVVLFITYITYDYYIYAE